MPKYKKINFKLLFAYVLAKMIHKEAERNLVPKVQEEDHQLDEL